jgi:hypothetical protein
MNDDHWVVGDASGLSFPADPAGLLDAGPDFLSEAFRRFTVLHPDNRVASVTDSQEFLGGSTGRKFALDVVYAGPTPLPTQLFVKFSRDFDDPRRDRGRTQMDREIRFAQLARGDDFPITVPLTLFADYHAESGTGILVTERISYGCAPIEPHYAKCLDYQMPEPLEHYRALLSAVARLAGAHRAGRLGSEFGAGFAFDPQVVSVGRRVVRSPAELRGQIDGYAAFAATNPQLLPAEVSTSSFIDRMRSEVVDIAARHDTVQEWLQTTDHHVALCHWNANVDNAWFWRGADGMLQCGLLDWGCVSEMNVAMPLWGALCSAEPETWERLGELLEHFAAEFVAAGGPPLDIALLRRQLADYAVTMGVTWLLDAPAYLRAAVPDLAEVADRRDPRIAENEAARSQLLMLSNALRLW